MAKKKKDDIKTVLYRHGLKKIPTKYRWWVELAVKLYNWFQGVNKNTE